MASDIIVRLEEIAETLDGGSYPDSFPEDCMEAANDIRDLRSQLSTANVLLRYELDRLRALLRLIAVDSGCHDGVLSEDVWSILKTETGIEPLFARKGVGSGN